MKPDLDETAAEPALPTPALATPEAVMKVKEQITLASRELDQLRGLLHDAFGQLIGYFVEGRGISAAMITDPDVALAESAQNLSAGQVQDMSDQLVVHITKRMRLVDLVLQRGTTEHDSELFDDPACPISWRTLDFGSVELF